MTAFIAVVTKKWDLIKFWLFLKFGIKFKDKTDMVENLAELDYDAFINYKWVFMFLDAIMIKTNILLMLIKGAEDKCRFL